jgi:uncharacterized membrane protein YeiH
VGAGLYLLLTGRGVQKEAAGLAAMGAIVCLRLAAIFWGLELPVVELPDEEARVP